MFMEDVEIQENHYGQGALHSRGGYQRLLQYLHKGAKVIYISLEDPGITQGGQRKGKPQVLQGEDHMAHFGPEEETNARGRRYFWRPMKGGQEEKSARHEKGQRGSQRKPVVYQTRGRP